MMTALGQSKRLFFKGAVLKPLILPGKQAKPVERQRFSEALVRHLAEDGFFLVEGGVESSQLEQYYEALSRLFAQPVQVLQGFDSISQGLEHGYKPPANPNSLGHLDDRKIAWIIQRGHNLYPGALPEFQTLSQRLYGQFFNLAGEICGGIRLFLEKTAGNNPAVARRFQAMTTVDGKNEIDGVLFNIRYPAMTSSDLEAFEGNLSAVSDEHVDSGLMSVIPRGTTEELELQDVRGCYVNPYDGVDSKTAVAVVAGKALEAVTQDLQSDASDSLAIQGSKHRVRTSPSGLTKDRFSAPFFINPRIDGPYVRLADGAPVQLKDPRSSEMQAKDPLPRNNFARQYLAEKPIWRRGITFQQWLKSIFSDRQILEALVTERGLDALVDRES